MNLQIENNKPTVNVIDDENILSFEFTSIDKNYLISQNENNIRLLLKKINYCKFKYVRKLCRN